MDSTATTDSDTSFTVYDSLGTAHTMNLSFSETATDQWQWTASCADGTMDGTSGTGTISFDDSGQVSGSTGSIQMDTTPANGSNTMNIALDFSGLTQLAGTSNVQVQSQNGLPAGVIQSCSIDSQGIVHGSVSNGADVVLGQLALATVANPAGLLSGANGVYTAGPNSGTPIVQTAAQAGSTVGSGELEMSNVDLSTEFSNLITTQRAYEANSKSITTGDQMLQDLIQMVQA